MILTAELVTRVVTSQPCKGIITYHHSLGENGIMTIKTRRIILILLDRLGVIQILDFCQPSPLDFVLGDSGTWA